MPDDLAVLKRDAARYRWARQQDADTLLDLYLAIPGTCLPEEWDAAIDEAMNASVIETPKEA